MNLPSISVVIPTYGRANILERTLQHLSAQRYPRERFEVLVVDNSSDDTPERVEALARNTEATIRLIRTRERLPAVKRNLGLSRAEGDLVIFLNDDLWVVPDFLAEHARSHHAESQPIAVLGRVEQSPEMPYTPFIEAYVPFAYHEIAAFADQRVSYRYFWSMNISLPRRTMIDRNLVFHEDWAEIGHEDIELGYRWSRSGHAIKYNPRATGDHYHPHTLRSACKLQESVGRGMRDLEKLIPDPGLLERYGIFTWRASRRAVTRGIARTLLFNAITAPLAVRWLERQPRNTGLTRWMYWKVLLHYTNRGYRRTPKRSPQAIETLPALRGEGVGG
jgi:glycosyltransferase involved in cell wall biosynthesis